MESFTIKSSSDFVRVTLDEVPEFPERTCYYGGYDAKTTMEIKSGDFNVKSVLWTSTGEIYSFFEQLETCNNNISGVASYFTYEGHLELTLTYDKLGHVNVKGIFKQQNLEENKLHFEFTTDQSFIISTVNELRTIAEKYGDNAGIKTTERN